MAMAPTPAPIMALKSRLGVRAGEPPSQLKVWSPDVVAW